MANKIGICGHCCVGKTTVGREIANRLGYDFISIGEYSREVNLFGRVADEAELNRYLHILGGDFLLIPGDLVVEGRTVHMSCKDQIASGNHDYFMMLLTAAVETRVERCLSRYPDKSCGEARQYLLRRTESINKALADCYHTDVFDESLFDCSIQTDGLTVDQVVDLAIRKIRRENYGLKKIASGH